MQEMYPLLTLIAVRLLSLHATSCSAERNWPRWRFTMRDNCKRLVVKKADKLISISSQAAVQRHGNDTDLFEQDIAAMCEAQQEEEDEQAEVKEVSDQDYDETPRGVKAGTRGGGRGPLHNRSNRELWRKVWQDLPDVDTLFDADEMESILESFYEADLSNELAPGAADFDVSCDEVEATHVFNLKDDFFDVSHQSIVLPTAIDMSLRPTSEPVCHYDAAAEVDRVLSGM
ncbi:TPA: hypothetical protein ACH3X1_006451 [Trebouxia sp. C0004]